MISPDRRAMAFYSRAKTLLEGIISTEEGAIGNAVSASFLDALVYEAATYKVYLMTLPREDSEWREHGPCQTQCCNKEAR